MLGSSAVPEAMVMLGSAGIWSRGSGSKDADNFGGREGGRNTGDAEVLEGYFSTCPKMSLLALYVGGETRTLE